LLVSGEFLCCAVRMVPLRSSGVTRPVNFSSCITHP
jgi:hypothetical protein